MSSARQVTKPSNITKLKEMYNDLIQANHSISAEDQKVANELIEGIKLLQEIRQPLRRKA